MNEIIEKEEISNKIYEIRGVQVMLDSDLALLYKCTNGTKDINKAVKRNIKRFPKEFYFELTDEETNLICSRFQSGTLNKSNNYRGYNFKYNPHVFTEQGVAMLSSVLHSETAINVSIQIINAFVAMRRYISNDLYKANSVLNNHENRLVKLEYAFDKINKKTKINTIFYDGQIYDAYSILMDILNQSTEEIIIIDNYAGKELLDILKDLNKKIIIISKNLNETLIKKYKAQYSNVEFKQLDIFHDRFIIIDRNLLYSCGASFKDLGKKCFAINEIESAYMLNALLERI